MKKMAHFQEVFEFITALTDCFDVFSQMLLCQTVVYSPAQAVLSKHSYQHKTGIIKLIATGRER